MPLTRPKAAQVNFDVTNITDPLLRFNSGQTGANDKDAGIVLERGDDTNVALIWDESADEFALVTTTEDGTTNGNVTISSYANIRANAFYGDGSNLTGVTASDVWTTSGSNIYYNTGNIGIGTSSPSKTLHVSSGTYSYPARITSTGGAVTGLEFTNTGSGANPPVVGSKSNDIFFEANNTERMRITSDGNVGIGQTSPSSPLHVTNSSTTTVTGYFHNTSAAGDSPALIVQGGANNDNTVGTFEVRDYNGNTDFHVSGTGNVTVSGYIKASKGIVQTVHNSTNVAASGNPINTWSEINSNYRVSITPRYSDSRILGTFHIPMNPTGATNILMAIAPWYSTDGGTTKTLLAQGNTAIQGSRFNLAVSWFRSNNGYDTNDMQNHVVHFYHDPGTTSTVTYGWYFRSEGSNTTYFNHSNGNNSTWGWIAPQYLELRELRT